MLMIRWVFILLISLIAVYTDLRYGKIHNNLNYIAFGVNILFLILHFNVEFIISLFISIIVNLLLVGILYMGGDAKLMINIAFAVGYKSLYVFLFTLICLMVVYVIKIMIHYFKNNELKTANKTKCGPAILVGILTAFIIFI